MYTIGTGALKVIIDTLQAGSNYADKLVCFVGTRKDKDGDSSATDVAKQKPQFAYDNTVFIVDEGTAADLQSALGIVITGYQIGDGVMYRSAGNSTGLATDWIDPITVPRYLIDSTVRPASGWAEVAYCWPRATPAQINDVNTGGTALPKVEGLPMVAVDPLTGGVELYVYMAGSYRLVASPGQFSVPIGGIVIWPSAINDIPAGYIAANGQEVDIATFNELWKVYTKNGTIPAPFGPASSGNFRLPLHSEGIIKAQS